MTGSPALVSRRTTFAFRGSHFRFDLSQSLFSSYAVDRGSAFLLDTLVSHLGEGPPRTILDVGCGTGVLGIVLGGLFPEATVRGTDRDALAVRFARRNARLNGCESASFQGALGTGSEGSADCVVCNLAAKAGEPVLRHLISACIEVGETPGAVGFVVVRNLEGAASEAVRRSGADIRMSRRTRDHTVLICSGKAAGGQGDHRASEPDGEAEPRPADLAPYVRNRMGFSFQGCGYELSTVYGVPDFDSLGYGTVLTAETMLRAPRPRGVAIWNPGQGHLPVLCCKLMEPRRILLAGRDLLALEASRFNLVQNGMREEQITVRHAAFPFETPGGGFQAREPWDLLILAPNPDPEMELCDALLAKLRPDLAPDAWVVLTAKSTAAYRMLRRRGGFRLTYDRKRHGLRAAVLSGAG